MSKRGGVATLEISNNLMVAEYRWNYDNVIWVLGKLFAILEKYFSPKISLIVHITSVNNVDNRQITCSEFSCIREKMDEENGLSGYIVIDTRQIPCEYKVEAQIHDIIEIRIPVYGFKYLHGFFKFSRLVSYLSIGGGWSDKVNCSFWLHNKHLIVFLIYPYFKSYSYPCIYDVTFIHDFAYGLKTNYIVKYVEIKDSYTSPLLIMILVILIAIIYVHIKHHIS